jgi:UDP-3-O-[3-hydroxymyristoyl] glucosamine N-acyltransferase
MRLSEALAGLEAEIVRDAEITGFGALNTLRDGILNYYSDPRFEDRMRAASGLRSVITTPELMGKVPEPFGLALCANPKETFLKAYLRRGREVEVQPPFPSDIAASARIHPRAVIAEHSVRIGEDVTIDANAVIHERVTVEASARIGANSVLGGDGFEVGMVEGRQIVLPHFGTVLVRRGAVIMTNTSVDWGMYGGCTEIGEDSVVDNLVHVAHNVKIGRNCQIIACTMLGGSCIVEDGARIGPNATISNRLRIGRNARVTLGSVVTRDVAENGHVTGNFAIPHDRFLSNLRTGR